jgi:hypothetical protein
MKKQLLRYWLAMNAGGVQAAAHSTKAYVSIAVAHAASDIIPALNWKQLAAVFGITFFMSVLDFLDKNPLPVDFSIPSNPLPVPVPAPSTPPVAEKTA